MQSSVLVVDDRRSSRRALAAEFEDAGFEVIEAEDGSLGWSRFCSRTPDLVITDLVMPNSDGIDLLTRIRARSEVPVVVFTAHGTIEAAVTALKRGADEFVASPDVEADELVGLATRLLEGASSADLSSRIAERILGESPAIRRVRERIAGLATLAEPVSICGEPGTGRDTVARVLHAFGPTRGGELLRVDGSGRTATGRLPESATVYLDDLDCFSPDAQCYWFERLSAGGRIYSPQLRVLASASRPIAMALDEERIDPRLARWFLRFEISLPPLRERPEDIPLLARALVERLGQSLGRPGVRLAPEVTRRLREEHWPGNVRELFQILEKLIAFSPSKEIRLGDLVEILAEVKESVASIRERQGMIERQSLIETLRATGGNVTRAAERLGKSRAAIYRLAEKHGIPLRREY
jgi:two-component system response regulator GlrR